MSKNSLAAYERGERLPDVDFLAVFADRTGADFNELLRLRLASGKTEEARARKDPGSKSSQTRLSRKGRVKSGSPTRSMP
ncbi:hypothetical protein [Candidatus Vondammii sp. HM_W22]|uniref:hypothetical protein n=1 Tax=Candidatus Vondammii sp. HM_W22 TaxID=2687299 RepID=UPI00403DB646